MRVDFTGVFLRNGIVEEKQVENQKGKELRLLLAEDDAVSRMVVEKLARGKGWKVTVAENGKKAIDVYRKQKFDIIIMDVQMPVMDGLYGNRNHSTDGDADK